MARGPNRTTATVVGGHLYHEHGSCAVGSNAWFAFLNTGPSFYYESNLGTLTARREIRHNDYYWYAFRKRDGWLHKCYLGTTRELTLDNLNAAVQKLNDAQSQTAKFRPKTPTPPAIPL